MDDPDTAYANAPFIADAESYPPRWASSASAFRTRLGDRAEIGLCYGPGARQRLDLFRPEGPARGLLVFIHGGFWKAFGREDWSHLAAGAIGRGWAVAVPGYTLAPAVRLSQITREIAAAVGVAAGHIAGPVVVAGHSAGGHLSARMACPDVAPPAAGRVSRVVPISPLADLRPLLAATMNDTLRLDLAEAEAESPLMHVPRPGIDIVTWVGADERPAFLDQARWLHGGWGGRLVIEPGRHHFDVIDALADPNSALVEAALGGI